MPQNDICLVRWYNRWITSRRLAKGKTTCSYHDKTKKKEKAIPPLTKSQGYPRQ